jgi:hypothetical protein
MAKAKFLVLKLQGPGPEVNVKEYKKRRRHSKNRLGCLSCRQKRVKVGGRNGQWEPGM